MTIARSSPVGLPTRRSSCRSSAASAISTPSSRLNEVGSVIWQLVDTPTTVHAIVEEIARTFDVPSDQAERDVVEFLGKLEEAGLIRPLNEPTARCEVGSFADAHGRAAWTSWQRRATESHWMETVSYGEFSQTFHARTMRQSSAAQRHHRGDAALSAHLRPLLQQPPDVGSRGVRQRAHLRGALPHPRRARRRGVSLAAVHRRRDLRAARLPRHLHLRQAEGIPDHPLHERDDDHAEDRRLSRGLAAIRDRNHALRPHEGDLRATDRYPGLIRKVPARHRPAARTAVYRWRSSRSP